MQNYNIRECTLIPQQKSFDEATSTIEITKFESVDQIVMNQIINIESDTFDSKVLLEIYNNL